MALAAYIVAALGALVAAAALAAVRENALPAALLADKEAPMAVVAVVAGIYAARACAPYTVAAA